jgi:hypothetical protein
LIIILRGTEPLSLVKLYQNFGRTRYLHLQCCLCYKYLILWRCNFVPAGHGSRAGVRHVQSSLARKPRSWVRIPLRAWMFSVCVCVCVCECVRAFFCVCVQVEALRRADHPPKESYRLSMIQKKKNLTETESFMEVGQGPLGL